jgi:hypothetical protein
MQECFQPLPTQPLEFEVGDLVVLRNHKIAQVVYVSKYGRVFAVEDGPEVQDAYVYNSDGTRYADSESETDIIAKMVMCNRKRIVLDEHKTKVPVTPVLPEAVQAPGRGGAGVVHLKQNGESGVINLPLPFSPKNGEVYYFVDYFWGGKGDVIRTIYGGNFRSDVTRSNAGNCFRTPEDAQAWQNF